VPDAVVRLTCPVEAQLYLDDRYAGAVGGRRGASLGLPAGFHRIELRADGYFPAYREVEVRRGDHASMHVELRPDLDQSVEPLARPAPDVAR
jgi:hypothetical protein